MVVDCKCITPRVNLRQGKYNSTGSLLLTVAAFTILHYGGNLLRHITNAVCHVWGPYSTVRAVRQVIASLCARTLLPPPHSIRA